MDARLPDRTAVAWAPLKTEGVTGSAPGTAGHTSRDRQDQSTQAPRVSEVMVGQDLKKDVGYLLLQVFKTEF